MEKQSGVTIVEFLIALSILAASFFALNLQLGSMKKALNDTTKLMSMDAFERSISDYLRSKEIAEYSALKHKSASLRRCFAGKGCRSGSRYEFPIYRVGEDRPITGSSALYDMNGLLCAKEPKSTKDGTRCGAFFLMTSLHISCFDSAKCIYPEVALLKAQLYAVDSKRPQRTFVREVQRSVNGRFPGRFISCDSHRSVLRGIGIRGEALCIPVKDVKFVDEDKNISSGLAVVKPKDCSEGDPTNQSFVRAIGSDGVIACAPKFW